MAFRLTRLFSLTLGYTHTEIGSTLRGLGFQSNRVRLGLTARFE